MERMVNSRDSLGTCAVQREQRRFCKCDSLKSTRMLPAG